MNEWTSASSHWNAPADKTDELVQQLAGHLLVLVIAAGQPRPSCQPAIVVLTPESTCPPLPPLHRGDNTEAIDYSLLNWHAS